MCHILSLKTSKRAKTTYSFYTRPYVKHWCLDTVKKGTDFGLVVIYFVCIYIYVIYKYNYRTVQLVTKTFSVILYISYDLSPM